MIRQAKAATAHIPAGVTATIMAYLRFAAMVIGETSAGLIVPIELAFTISVEAIIVLFQAVNADQQNMLAVVVGAIATVQTTVRGLALTVLGLVSPAPVVHMDAAAQHIAKTVLRIATGLDAIVNAIWK